MAKKITAPREITINRVDCRNIVESFAKGFQYNDAKIYPTKALKTDVKYLSEDWVNKLLADKKDLFDKSQFAYGLLEYNSNKKIEELNATMENMAARMQEMANELTKADREIERLKSDNDAHKNRIRVLEKFVPKSDNNVTLD